MSWSLLSETATPPDGTEQWAFVLIAGDPSHIAYGIRAIAPDFTPQSWNTMGFFGLYQVVEDRVIVSRTYPLPLIGRGPNQVLRYLGERDFDLSPSGLTAFGVTYYIHKWVESSAFQIWVLT